MKTNLMHRAVITAVTLTALMIQGCGGSNSGPTPSTGTAPTSTTRNHVAQHLSAYGQELAGMTFTPFGPAAQAPAARISSGPYYSSTLGLWVQLSVSATTFTETFYQDKAETEPAGNATYTLDIETKTLSGKISITKGPYAGLTGAYSQTLTSNGTDGNYSFTLPSGATVTCNFQVTIGSNGAPSGTSTQTVTLTNGYSIKSTVIYNSNRSFKITATDSNGYQGALNFASDLSGTGTISGPDPGLPATIVWNSVGTGQVTFANGLVVPFTNWQLPTV